MENSKDSKQKHSKRIHQKENHIKRQMEIAKAYGYDTHTSKEQWLKQPHRYQKMSIFNCGDPNCHMCGNPRKFYGEKTIQEQKFEQKKLHEEE